MKKTFQIWAISRTGLDSAAAQPCASYDSLASCMEVVDAHNNLMAERGIIPASEKHLIPDFALCQAEWIFKTKTKQYVLLQISHIQEAWV